MLQVQDKAVKTPRLVGLKAVDHCRLCEHLNPYARVDGCTQRVGDSIGSRAAGLTTLCVWGTDCRYYVEAPQCFACGIIIRPQGSSPVAVPLAGTKGGVTCESCAETLKVRGFFRYGGSQDGQERRWRPGEGIFEKIGYSTSDT